jgi:hypothetical protein
MSRYRWHEWEWQRSTESEVALDAAVAPGSASVGTQRIAGQSVPSKIKTLHFAGKLRRTSEQNQVLEEGCGAFRASQPPVLVTGYQGWALSTFVRLQDQNSRYRRRHRYLWRFISQENKIEAGKHFLPPYRSSRATLDMVRGRSTDQAAVLGHVTCHLWVQRPT